MSGSWIGSSRKDTLPQNWGVIRKRVLLRDDYSCQALMVSTGQRCGASAGEVDHINRFGSQTDMANLQTLCSWHHSRKSS